jgi:late competence protein required for DNA uptake (superfamily II DNA/RNA helicase)
MMDELASKYTDKSDDRILDACLASNIIEVSVDIDRLSLMGIVGQPKTTATYIQVSGRVGRRWRERPGLILMLYSPEKSRDRSHYEQFHSYHRRLYERVEPTTATPFALSAIHRGAAGVLIAWARQHSQSPVQNHADYEVAVEFGYKLLCERCMNTQDARDVERSLQELERVKNQLLWKWSQNPQKWEQYPPVSDGEYLMLWPGQYATIIQKDHGVAVPTSMRQVDGSAELQIHSGYAAKIPAAHTT